MRKLRPGNLGRHRHTQVRWGRGPSVPSVLNGGRGPCVAAVPHSPAPRGESVTNQRAPSSPQWQDSPPRLWEPARGALSLGASACAPALAPALPCFGSVGLPAEPGSCAWPNDTTHMTCHYSFNPAAGARPVGAPAGGLLPTAGGAPSAHGGQTGAAQPSGWRPGRRRD